MKWYEIRDFKDRLVAIEQFLIEIAANEEKLMVYGFKHAFTLPSAEKALEALKTFNEDFSTLKRFLLRMDRTLGQELEQLDSEGKLVEQVSLISLRLRMSEVRKPMSISIAAINQMMFYLPLFSQLVKSKGLFDEEAVSLHKTIINLGRLRGITTVFYDHLFNLENSDNEVFKPSNVKPDRVVDFIDAALTEIELLSSVSPSERARIEGYLHEAKKEALSSGPSWSKIVGALVIVAAITSGLADAPNAAKSIKDAIEYILGTSVEKPLQKYLPSPNEHDKIPAPVDTLA
jgi:hypothetical protein